MSAGAALAGLAHRETDGVELGAQRRVDHAAADANHEAADQRGIDLHVEVDLGLGDVAERRFDLAEHPLRRLLRDAHLGLDDALRLGDEGAEAADHVGQREQPPFPCDEADEVLGEPADAGPFEDRRDGLLLRLGAEDRAPDQPPQILALADERVEGVEVAGDRIDRLVVARELEQRGGIAARHARNHGSALRTLFSHRLLSIWSRARHGGAGRRLETRSGHWIDARKRQKAPPHGAAALAWDFGGRKASTERSFKRRPRVRAATRRAHPTPATPGLNSPPELPVDFAWAQPDAVQSNGSAPRRRKSTMPQESVKPALRAGLRMHEIGSASPYKLFFAAKGKSGASFGFMQGDLAAGQPDVTKTFRRALQRAGMAEAPSTALPRGSRFT